MSMNRRATDNEDLTLPRNNSMILIGSVSAVIAFISVMGSIFVYQKSVIEEFSDVKHDISNLRDRDIPEIKNSINKVSANINKNADQLEALNADVNFLTNNEELVKLRTEVDYLKKAEAEFHHIGAVHKHAK